MAKDRPLRYGVTLIGFSFSAICGLILGLLCVQSATGSRSPCNLRVQFPCRSNISICIALSQVRDGTRDCPDGSDEEVWQGCPRGHFRCRSGSGCLPRDRIRDGVSDCSDGSDEECPPRMHRCQCGIPHCIERRLVGDGIRHCLDGSDEGEDYSNYLCPETFGEQDLFASQNRKRRKRQTARRRDPVVYPTGLISAFTGTEVNADKTTLHTTELYRTYVDGSYAQVLQSTSAVIHSTPTYSTHSLMDSTDQVQSFGSLSSGKVYQTAVSEPVSSMSSSEASFTKHSTLVRVNEENNKEGHSPGDTLETSEDQHSEFYYAEDREQQGTVPRKIDDNYAETSIKNDADVAPVFDDTDQRDKYRITLSTSRPIAITRYVQSTAYPQSGETVLAYAGGNTIGRVGTIRRGPHSEPATLRGHPSRTRQGRLYNPSAITGRRVHPHEDATIITDQFFFPRHRQSMASNEEGSTEAYIDNAYYEVEGLYNREQNLQDELQKVGNIRPTVHWGENTFRDKRLTKTVGLYGPIYDAYYDTNVADSATQTTKTSHLQEFSTLVVDNEAPGSDKTITLLGFAQFSTKISGTNYVFMPASTQPRTFTPRVSRTSFSNTILAAPRSDNNGLSSLESDRGVFFRKPLFGTDTREFISQMSMFTSTVKEPIEIQKTMFTSTVATKQPSDARTRLPKVGEETMIAETLPLNLATIYVQDSNKPKNQFDDGIFSDIGGLNKNKFINESPIELDISQIVDIPEKIDSENNTPHPTGLVSSITGTEVGNDMTTHWTTLIFGTYIGNTYAHIIESTSSIFYTISKTDLPEETKLDISETPSHQIYEYTSQISSEMQDVSYPDSSVYDTSEILPSLTDMVSDASWLGNTATETLSSATTVEILTSGFILPSSRYESSASTEAEASPGFVKDSEGLILDAENDSKQKDRMEFDTETTAEITSESTSEFPTPGVMYVDDYEHSLNYSEDSEHTTPNVIEILTGGFILPGLSGSSTPSSLVTEPNLTSLETKEISDLAVTEKSVLSEDVSIDSLEHHINFNGKSKSLKDEFLNESIESEMRNVNTGATDLENESKLIANDTVSHLLSILPSVTSPGTSSIESSPSLVFLTGDFILPRAPVYELPSSAHQIASNQNEVTFSKSETPNIITDGFILPGVADRKIEVSSEGKPSSGNGLSSSMTSDSLSILTAGFILPGPTGTTTTKVQINAPSSALLTADFILPKTEDSYESSNLDETEGRSAGIAEKIILPDDIIMPTPTTTTTESEKDITVGTSSEKENESAKTDAEISAKEDLSLNLEDSIGVLTNREEKSLKGVSSEVPQVEELLPSISFPITYYTTSTYFTTFLQDGKTVVTSRQETISQVYTDSDHLRRAQINPTHTVFSAQAIRPTKTKHPYDNTFTYYTTVVKDGTTIVSSHEDTIPQKSHEATTPELKYGPSYAVLTYPTTYYTTLSYFTTLLREDSSTTVITSERVISNVITPTEGGQVIKPASTSIVLHTNAPAKIDISNPKPTTFFTTYTYYTTFHKDGTTSVNTRLHTVSDVVYGTLLSSPDRTDTPIVPKSTSTASYAETSQTKPTTYFTTYTYYTTYLKGGSTVVSSREDVVSSVAGKTTTPSLILSTTSTSSSPATALKTTFYTTYTYYTTLLKQGTTTVSTRKETLTNVVQGSLTSSPTSISRSEDVSILVTPSPTLKTYYTTYTYFTTFLRDGSSVVSSRESTVKNVVTESTPATTSHYSSHITPTRTFTTYFTTLTSYYTLSNGEETPSVSTVYSTLTDVVAVPFKVKSSATTERIEATPVVTTYLTTYTYYTTLLNDGEPIVSSREETISNVVTLRNEGTEIYTPSTIVHAVTPLTSLASKGITSTYYTTYTYFTTYLVSGSPSVATRYDTITSVASDVQSNGITATQTSETPSTTSIHLEGTLNTVDNIRDTIISTRSPETHYTTFTYYTTELKNGSPVVHSRTHIISSITQQNKPQSDISSEEQNPIVTRKVFETFKPTPVYTEVSTFYTTYTFYTTLFSGSSPIIQTRVETVSNFITATVTPSLTNEKTVTITRTDLDEAEGEVHEKRIPPTTADTYYTTHTFVTTSLKPDGETQFITRRVTASASVEQNQNTVNQLELASKMDTQILSPSLQTCCHETDPFPRTYFTTYTYYTTRYHGGNPIINTRHETITNVVKSPIDSSTPIVTKGENTQFVPSIVNHSSRTNYEPASPRTDVQESTRVQRLDEVSNNSSSVSNEESETTTSGGTFATDENTYINEITPRLTTSEPEQKENITVPSLANDDVGTIIPEDRNNTSLSNPETDKTTETTFDVTTNNATMALILENTTSELTSIDAETTTEMTVLNTTETESIDTTTEKETTVEETTTLPAETTTIRRSIFARRRNRPAYKPNPSIRSTSLATSVTSSTTPKTTTKPSSLLSRRNTTRLLFRRPTEGSRTFPLRRLRPGRPGQNPTSDSSDDTTNKRRKRSFYNPGEGYELPPPSRKLLATNVEENITERDINKNNVVFARSVADSVQNQDLSFRQTNSKDEYPQGLIRSVEAKAINDGVTTIYATEIHGTFINGAYAQVVRSTVRVHSDPSNEIQRTSFPVPVPTSTLNIPSYTKTTNDQKVGLVSSVINISIGDGTTTLYTTNVYGTYVGEVYAHIAQTTSSVISPTPTPRTAYSTGLISSSVRTEINYDSTTVWTTQIYGTFVNGYYAHIASTFSNIYASPTKKMVQPTLLPSGFNNHIYAQATPDFGLVSKNPFLSPSLNRNPPSIDDYTSQANDYKTGLLSSFVSDYVNSGTTTQYITNVYGTFIGQQYAQHAQTTSRVITPTATVSTEGNTRSIGLVSTIVKSVTNDNTLTLYRTEVYGTYIGQLYAQIARTSTEFKLIPSKTSDYNNSPSPTLQKTGLLSSNVIRSEVIDGTTTVHLNEVYGTYIGSAYAHIAKSTTRLVQPVRETKALDNQPSSETSQKTGIVSSSVNTEVNDGTTTLHTTEIHGTYIGNYYAHIARRTSSVLPFTPSPTSAPLIQSTSSKTEGLVLADTTTEVNYGTTTLHTREVYGTFINGYYAHIARSTSNVITPTPTSTISSTSTTNTGLVSAITSSEYNHGILTLHTTEIYGTSINGFYAHIARSTSSIVTTPSFEEFEQPTGILSASTSTLVNNGITTLYETSTIGTEINGRYIQSLKSTSSILQRSQLYTEDITNPLGVADFLSTIQSGVARDELDTAIVNKLDSGNSHEPYETSEITEFKTPFNLYSQLDILSPSLNSENILETSDKHTPSLSFGLSEESSAVLTSIFTLSSTPELQVTTKLVKEKQSPRVETSTSPTTEASTQEKPSTREDKTTKVPDEDFEDYNDYFDDDKTRKHKEHLSSKPISRTSSSRARDQSVDNPDKNKTPVRSSLRKTDRDYDDYDFEEDYDDFDGRKFNSKISASLLSSRYRTDRAGQTNNPQQNLRNSEKSSVYKKDYDDYEDEEYEDSESQRITPTKNVEATSTKTETPSSVRIRPFVGRGRPTFGTAVRTTTTRPSFTIQFRRPSRTRNSRAFGQRSDSENNDFDDELHDEEDEGDIEASEAVVTTATPQALPARRKPFGSSRYQPFSRNAQSSTTSRPLNANRNRRPFGRPSANPSPTPSLKDTISDYEENTTEDDDFDEYDDIQDKTDSDGRYRNFRSTRRPPSRRTFGERRSASNKRGSFRQREDEEIENDDFDTTTPDYRGSRNRPNQRKPSRYRNNRGRSPSLKASFNSVNRDEDEESLQPINRIRNNNRNRRPSYNPRTRRQSKTVTETATTLRKPHLTVTSVVTTVKTLPIYHGFRTSYATLTTTTLDTSIINPSEYSTVVSDGLTKTLFSSRVGYPDGFENFLTTITEVVVTTTSLASVKLVPIKIGFSTRTDTITDIQVLTTLSTLYTTISPDTPTPTAFPQQFQPPQQFQQPQFYPQLGPQNHDFGYLTSVATQIVTSTTVVPIVLRGRTILSTLITTSTAQSTVVQTPSIRVPQVPSAAPFIPQPYFAFQPLTTLLTLYVTGEYGEIKPVVTTVTVPLYQQPVFHTKVARSLQSTLSDYTVQSTEIPEFFIKTSSGQETSRDVDIETHYDKLLSSGLEEINDMSEISSSYYHTEPLETTNVFSTVRNIPQYDITTISKGPLTEIYEQRATISVDGDGTNAKQNEIESNKRKSDEEYGVESRYSFRRLQQFVEEDPANFRPQRDFTRLRRPPQDVIRASVTDPRSQPSRQIESFSDGPFPPQNPNFRRPPRVEVFNEEPFSPVQPLRPSPRERIRGTRLQRRPPQRPTSEFRPFIERPPQANFLTGESRGEILTPFQPPQTSPQPQNDFNQIEGLINSLRTSTDNVNRLNGFSGSPALEDENNDGFRPLSVAPGLRRGNTGNTDRVLAQPVPPRRLRVTRPIPEGVSLNSGIRRVTRTRSLIPFVPTAPVSLENELTSLTDITPPIVTVLNTEQPVLNDLAVDQGTSTSFSTIEDVVENASHSDVTSSISETADQDVNEPRRTIIRRLRPSFIPGDGNGARRPVVIRRTRTNSLSASLATEESIPDISSDTESTSTTSAVSDETTTRESIASQPTPTAVDDTENEDSLDKKPLRKVIRLRKPEGTQAGISNQRRRIIITRKPQGSGAIEPTKVQARGPVSTISTIEDAAGNNLVPENDHSLGNVNENADNFNKIAVIPKRQSIPQPNNRDISTRTYPITYYTTLTYFTTFLQGSSIKYSSREAIFSNTIHRTLNPNLVSVIRTNDGLILPTSGNQIVHLASRTLGETTTIVNLASRQSLYNSELYKLLSEEDASKVVATIPIAIATRTPLSEIKFETANINYIAPLPKTYVTLYTYLYTFYDGLNTRQSARAETVTNVATDPAQFLLETIGSSINSLGYLTVGPETKTVHLGSRNVEGTATEVNLDLKTLIHFDGLKNVVIERTHPLQYITPTRTMLPIPQTDSSEQPVVFTSSRVPPRTVLSSAILEPSYASANELFGTDQPSNVATETYPLISNIVDEATSYTDDYKPVLRVTSIIHKPSGPLRSGVFTPRPGVRVRVRPVGSRRLIPNLVSPSFEMPIEFSDVPSDIGVSPSLAIIPTPSLEASYITEVLDTEMFTDINGIGLDNEVISEDYEGTSDGILITDGGVVPSKQRLKVTVRRPQSESVSRTHTRFVLPSRFEITSRPLFYVVTRTGALGVVSPSQRPFTVKISRKLKPSGADGDDLIASSTTVVYDTYTTLSSVPVIFGLDTSFRNVLVTTSSPLTVSQPLTPTYESPFILPSNVVVLTYFTTTTFTIPYAVGDQTLYTTVEETNSRIVTQTFDGLEMLSYSTVTRPTADIATAIPTISPLTSVDFGPGGPTTYILPPSPALATAQFAPDTSVQTSPEPSETVVYDTQTFFTTYTFFTTFYTGTDAFISSSEQIITNVVTVPVTKMLPLAPTTTPSLDGPITVTDTSEQVTTRTNYNTVTFYATLFSDTSSFVTPIEEIETQVETVTETYTITKTILPTSSATIPSTPLLTPEEEPEPSVVLTQTFYTTFTNFVTLFQGSDTVVSNLEEVVSNVVTMTVPASDASSFAVPTTPSQSDIKPSSTAVDYPLYTTREVLSTQTHYLTLFNGDEHILSSIEEIVTSFVTEVPQPSPSVKPETTYYFDDSLSSVTFESSPVQISSTEITETFETETTSPIETYHPELVPSIRTIYSTLTFYTTYFSGSSSIIASQEEVLTSFVTLFVPPSLITSSEVVPTLTTTVPDPTTTTDPSVFVFTTTDYSTLTLYTTLFNGDETRVISSEKVVPEVITATIRPTSTSSIQSTPGDESVLTFLTTFTYYTTYFSGTDAVIASSESVVTQYVTIESAPSISPVSSSETAISTTPVDETIIGISTRSGSDISSSFKDDLGDVKIIGVSSVVVTEMSTSTSTPDSTDEIETKGPSQVETGTAEQTIVATASSTRSEVLGDFTSAVFNKVTEDSSPRPAGGRGAGSRFVDESIVAPSEFDSSSTIRDGSTVIFYTDVTLASTGTPSLPVTSSSIVTESTEIIGFDGKITTLAPSATLMIVTGTDGFVTKLSELDAISLSRSVMVSTPDEPSTTSSSDVKPATVIELSDLLGGNTALGGDIGLRIQDIVSLITGKKNKTDTDGTLAETTTVEPLTTEKEQPTETTTKSSTETESTTETRTDTSTPLKEEDTDKVVSKELDYPVFVLPSDSVIEENPPTDSPAPVYVPIPVVSPVEILDTESTSSTVETSEVSPSTSDASESLSTSVITGARTVFILPTQVSSITTESKKSESSITSDDAMRDLDKEIFSSSIDSSIASEITTSDETTEATTSLSPSIGTSVVSGIRTVFFGSSADSAMKFRTGAPRLLDVSKVQTVTDTEPVLGRANIPLQSSKSFTTITKDGQTIVSRTTSGATTIFFPGQIPKYSASTLATRYITSVESITRTLALTTTRTYYTRDSTLTVPSVYTTTIPPRTFVSTVIGTRTILGILPEPTETVQIHKTMEPSERTTTVTTTTLIFNSIPSTVVRTLVLPTGVQSQGTSGESTSYTIPDASIFSAGTERPARPPEVADSTSHVNADVDTNNVEDAKKVPVQKSREETYLRAAGPRLRDHQPDVRLENVAPRPPIVVTDAVRPEDDPFMNGRNGVCDPKCQPYKKEMCKESNGLWECRCRPGHARRDDHEICSEIHTFVLLLKVMKLGNSTVKYSKELGNSNSKEFKKFVEAAKEGISEVYRYTNVRDHYLGAEVNEVIPVLDVNRDSNQVDLVSQETGVIVNFTIQVSKSVSENLLEQELVRSLQLTEERVGDSFLLAEALSQSIQDFDECSDRTQNDCAFRAICENLPGTYTCQCKEGYEDMDSKFPGRTCLTKTENCEYCHGRGDCLESDDSVLFCRCLPMYIGRRCEINGLVLAIALPTAVAVVVLLLCGVLCCCRRCRRKTPATTSGDPTGNMFRGIALRGPMGSTLDRKAMIDTSSESSGEHGRRNSIPYNAYQESGDVTSNKDSKRSDLSLNRSLSTGYTVPPVMIPRARPQSPPNKPANYAVYNGQVYVW